MAITLTLLNTRDGNLTSGTITPSSDSLLIVATTVRRSNPFDVTGITTTLSNVGTWTEVEGPAHDYGAQSTQCSIFYARVTGSPGSGTITVTTSLTPTASITYFLEATGFNTTTPIYLSSSGADTTANPLSLGGTTRAGDVGLALLSTLVADSIAPANSDWTEVQETLTSTYIRAQIQKTTAASITQSEWTTTGTVNGKSSAAIVINGAAVTINTTAASAVYSASTTTKTIGAVTKTTAASSATFSGAVTTKVIGASSKKTGAASSAFSGAVTTKVVGSSSKQTGAASATYSAAVTSNTNAASVQTNAGSAAFSATVTTKVIGAKAATTGAASAAFSAAVTSNTNAGSTQTNVASAAFSATVTTKVIGAKTATTSAASSTYSAATTSTSISGGGGGVTFSDNFNRTNSTTLGSDWSQFEGDDRFEIVSNKANWAAGGYSYERYNAGDATSPDMFAQAYIMPPTATGGYPGVLARCSTTDLTCYAGVFVQDSAKWSILRYTGSGATETLIQAAATTGPYSSNTLYKVRLEVSGTGATVTLKLYVDDVLKVDTVDTSGSRITSGTQAGITYAGGAFGTTFEDFSGGDLTASGVTATTTAASATFSGSVTTTDGGVSQATTTAATAVFSAGVTSNNLVPTGFPGIDYQVGVLNLGSLTPYSGTFTTSYDGQIVENLDITGRLDVFHNNVTVRNCRVRSVGGWCISNQDQWGSGTQYTGTVIEDCTFDASLIEVTWFKLDNIPECGGPSGHAPSGHTLVPNADFDHWCDIEMVRGGQLTMRRCDINGGGLQINLNAGNSTLEQNYIHDGDALPYLNGPVTPMVTDPPCAAHRRGISLGAQIYNTAFPIVLRNNTLLMNTVGSNLGLTGAATYGAGGAGVPPGTPASAIVVEDNLFGAWGNTTLSTGNGGTVINNAFCDAYNGSALLERSDPGWYGPWVGSVEVHYGNYWYDGPNAGTYIDSPPPDVQTNVGVAVFSAAVTTKTVGVVSKQTNAASVSLSASTTTTQLSGGVVIYNAATTTYNDATKTWDGAASGSGVSTTTGAASAAFSALVTTNVKGSVTKTTGAASAAFSATVTSNNNYKIVTTTAASAAFSATVTTKVIGASSKKTGAASAAFSATVTTNSLANAAKTTAPSAIFSATVTSTVRGASSKKTSAASAAFVASITRMTGPPGSGRLEWGSAGSKLFETGLDRGVLYIDGVGVPWNGLVSVDVNSNNETTELYFDGNKVFDLVTLGDFSGNIKAVTYPDEFLEFEGNKEHATGLIVHDQPVDTFGLSYRTKVGNDIYQEEYGYKIHVLYNLTAVPKTAAFESINDSISPNVFEWDISGVPEYVEYFRPTVHLVFDSTNMSAESWQKLENTLYGTVSTNPTLPAVVALLDSGGSVIIVDHGDGTWSATGHEELITMLDATTFQIESERAVYLNANTYTITSF